MRRVSAVVPDGDGRRTGAGAGRTASVLGLVGARGGAGTSTLAALSAARLARRTSTVLVDLDPVGGGLDVTVGLEAQDGARWPELAGARGEVDGQDVLALLPRWGGCAVLSADRDGGAPDPDVVGDVLQSLAGVVGALVLDLPREGLRPAGPEIGAGDVRTEMAGPTGGTPFGACDAIAVVARRDLRSVAGLLAARPRLLASGAPVGLVVPGAGTGGMSVQELAVAVDLPVVWSGPAGRRLARSAERGVLPRRGSAVRAARAVVAWLEGVP